MQRRYNRTVKLIGNRRSEPEELPNKTAQIETAEAEANKPESNFNLRTSEIVKAESGQPHRILNKPP